jgi:hypothetical protein
MSHHSWTLGASSSPSTSFGKVNAVAARPEHPCTASCIVVRKLQARVFEEEARVGRERDTGL